MITKMIYNNPKKMSRKKLSPSLAPLGNCQQAGSGIRIIGTI